MNIEDTDNNDIHILKIHKIAAALVPSVKVRPFQNVGVMPLLKSWGMAKKI